MADVVISPPLADQLRAIAKRQNRPVEDFLADILARYQAPAFDEIDARLAEMGVIAPPSSEDATPPLSEDEALALADRIGRAGPLSTLVIEERREGP
jgi:hypothetical protein